MAACVSADMVADGTITAKKHARNWLRIRFVIGLRPLRRIAPCSATFVEWYVSPRAVATAFRPHVTGR